jgi:hypothetical protein
MQLPADPISAKYRNLGEIITEVVKIVYWVAGVALLLNLIVGGYQLMMSQGNPDGTKAAWGRITNSFVGFFIIFASYLVVRVVEFIFGVKIF